MLLLPIRGKHGANVKTAKGPPVKPVDVGLGEERASSPNVIPEAPPRARATVRIAGLAVANSGTSYSQREVLARLGLEGDEFAERIFARSGVHHRHLNLEPDFLADTLQGRGERVEEQLMDWSVDAVDRLAIEPSEIAIVLSASLYSLGCPALANKLSEHYGLEPWTDRYHLTGVGCASAVPLVRLASQALSEQPGKQGIVVVADSMSSLLTTATPDDPRTKTIGSAIFGDGCAALLLSSDEGAQGPLILDSGVHQIAGTIAAVTMGHSPQDTHLELARELPELAAAGLAGLVEEFLAPSKLERSAIDHWIVHPGGRRIIESMQDVLGLSRDQVQTSWDTLSEHGNVGTPSSMYVLGELLDHRQPRAGELGLMVTIGPGVTAGLMLLQF